MTLLDLWLHDTADPKVVRFPLFTADTPYAVIAEACVKFRRSAHYESMTDQVFLEPRK